MRKILLLVITASIVITTLNGCAEGFEAGRGETSNLTTSDGHTQIPEITMCDQYTVLLESNSIGFEDTTTPRMDGYGTRTIKRFVEECREDDKKTVTLFGETVTLTYTETWQSDFWQSNQVFYDCKNPSVTAAFDSQTDKLVYCFISGAGSDRSFQSEINEYSDENAFMAYVKSIISQYMSVEDYEYEIQTDFYEYYEPGGYYGLTGTRENGYLNNTDGVEDFYADYHVTFYKTMNGIRLNNQIDITVNNTGEVACLSLNTLYVSYEPFKDVVVDLQKAETLIEEAISKFAPKNLGKVTSIEYNPQLVAVNDGTLWLRVQAGVYFSCNGHNNLTSAFLYMIKVAEIVQ